MELREYERLLRAYFRRRRALGAKREDAHCAADRTKAFRLIETGRGQDLIAVMPSAREIRAAARAHVERTLRLAGLQLEIGRVRMTGTHTALDARFTWTQGDERYQLFGGFEVSFTVTMDEGQFRERVIVEESEDGRWCCSSGRFTAESIRRALSRPRRRVVVVTVADQQAAAAIVRMVRGKAERVVVWTQARADRMSRQQMWGWVHSPDFEKSMRAAWEALRKSPGRKAKRNPWEAVTPLPRRRRV